MKNHPIDSQESVVLRDLVEADLPILYKFQRDPVSVEMAAFPSRDYEAFMAHWAEILADQNVNIKTIVVGGEVVGNVSCFEKDDRWNIGYWVGQQWWGKGIATRALSKFLPLVEHRPLWAYVAKHNKGSIRVLEKCGFTVAGEGKIPLSEGFGDVEEFIFILHA